MASTVYSVVVDLSTRGSLAPAAQTAAAKVGDLGSAVERVSSKAWGLASAFGSALGGAVERVGDLTIGLAKLGGAALVTGAAYSVAKLNNELEKTQISLAAIFSANGATANVGEGMGVAADVMAQMRKDAAALPGEFKDLVGIFKDISVPGFQAGMGVNKMRGFAAQTMAVGAVLGLNMEQTGREMAMLLEGRAGAHNVLGMRLAGLGGDRAKDFNKMGAGARAEALSGELAKFAGAIDLYSKSFEGLSSTFLDNVKKFAGTAVAPLFERVKSALASTNDWFDQNEDRVGRLALAVGDKLGAAWDFVVDKARRLEPILERVESLIENKSASGLGTDLVKAGAVMAAMKFGPGALGAAATVGKDAFDVAKAGAPLLAGGAGDALGAIGAALNPVALAAAAVAIADVVAGAVAIAGAIHSLTDESSAFYQRANELWNRIQSRGEGAIEALSEAWKSAGPAITYVADAMGVQLLSAINAVASAAETGARVLSLFADAGAYVIELSNTVDDLGASALGAVAGVTNLKTAINKLVESGAKNTTIEKASDGSNKPAAKTGGGGGGGGTHIQKVEIVVSSNQEPSRIARLTLLEIENLQRNPKVSRSAPNWSAPRPF